jgi:hypothetical protein
MFFYVWLVMEPIRLIVGHVGNLGERVAWLAPFWILTLFPQLVTQVYFLMSTLITGWVTLPIEYVRPHAHHVLAPLPPPPGPSGADSPGPLVSPISRPVNPQVLHVTLLLLYVAQLFEGYHTGKRLIIKAAADYHLQPVVPEDVAEL